MINKNLQYEIETMLRSQVDKFLGEGNSGSAYLLKDRTVAKITNDYTEYAVASYLVELAPSRYSTLASVYRTERLSNGQYLINKILITPLNTIDYLLVSFNDIETIFEDHSVYYKYIFKYLIDVVNSHVVMDVEKLFTDSAYKLLTSDQKNILTQLNMIANELRRYKIFTVDFLNPTNIGYIPTIDNRYQDLKFFDIGCLYKPLG